MKTRSCGTSSGLVVLLLSAAVVAPIVSGAQQPEFGVTARTVRVPVSVFDKRGEPVTGLVAADFKIAENGKPQPIALFSTERRPMRIALALDVSGSMWNKIDQVEDAVEHFSALLEPKDEIMVLTFNLQVRVILDFTSDRERLATVLGTLQPAGSTALYDAAYEAIRRVGDAPAESKAVVLVTDGINTGRGVGLAALRVLAQRSGVPVFALGLASENKGKNSETDDGGREGPGGGGGGGRPGDGGSGNFGGPKRPHWRGSGGSGGPAMTERKGFDEKTLRWLADETGGRVEILKDVEQYTPGEGSGRERLRRAVEVIALTLRHRYLVGYEPPGGKAGWREIRVEVDRPDGAAARARKSYYGES